MQERRRRRCRHRHYTSWCCCCCCGISKKKFHRLFSSFWYKMELIAVDTAAAAAEHTVQDLTNNQWAVVVPWVVVRWNTTARQGDAVCVVVLYVVKTFGSQADSKEQQCAAASLLYSIALLTWRRREEYILKHRAANKPSRCCWPSWISLSPLLLPMLTDRQTDGRTDGPNWHCKTGVAAATTTTVIVHKRLDFYYWLAARKERQQQQHRQIYNSSLSFFHPSKLRVSTTATTTTTTADRR